MSDSFLFYRSFYEALDDIPEQDQLVLLKAVCRYALDGDVSEISGVANGMFKLIKPQIDANNKRRSDGNKGGRHKTNGYEDEKPVVTESKTSGYEDEKPVVTESKTSGYEVEKPNDNDNDNDNDNVNDNVNVTATQSDATAAARKQVAEEWNKTTFKSITQINTSSIRGQRLNARLKEYGLDNVLKAIRIAEESAYLHDQTWFTFDWFIRPNNFPKVLEGNYSDRAAPKEEKGKFDDIAARLINQSMYRGGG